MEFFLHCIIKQYMMITLLKWFIKVCLDMIVIINPSNGNVDGVIDCTGLLPRQLRYEDTDVLNGIAHNPEDGRIYLTGKNWCRLYEVRIVEK